MTAFWPIFLHSNLGYYLLHYVLLWFFILLFNFSDESYAGPIDKDHLVVPDGPITRSRAKKIKEAIVGLVQSTWAKLAYSPSKASTFKMGFREEEPALIHVIQAKK